MQGVINIHRARGIDGHKGEVREVLSSAIGEGVNGLRYVDQGLCRFVCPGFGQSRPCRAVAIFYARRRCIPEALQHFCRGFAVFNRVAQQRAGDEITRGHAVASVRRYKEPPRETGDVGHDKGRFPFLNDLTREGIKTCFDQPLNFSNGSARFVFLAFDGGGGSDANSSLIAWQHLQHFIRGNKNFTAVSRHRKSIAVLGPFDGRFGALVLGFEFVSESLELRHRVAIEHSRFRLLNGSESRSDHRCRNCINAANQTRAECYRTSCVLSGKLDEVFCCKRR